MGNKNKIYLATSILGQMANPRAVRWSSRAVECDGALGWAIRWTFGRVLLAFLFSAPLTLGQAPSILAQRFLPLQSSYHPWHLYKCTKIGMERQTEGLLYEELVEIDYTSYLISVSIAHSDFVLVKITTPLNVSRNKSPLLHLSCDFKSE